MARFKNELWYAIAAQLLTAWRDQLAAITGISDRRIIEERGSWQGYMRVRSVGAMGYTISEDALGFLFDEIPDRIYDPVIRDQIVSGRPPLVTGAAVSGGTALVCDAPGSGITTQVYEWFSATQEWELIGALVEHSTPGSGYYVLVNQSASGVLGLPSQFLSIA